MSRSYQEFQDAIQLATASFTKDAGAPALTTFLHTMQQIVDSTSFNNLERMTRMTVFFEGFYRSLEDSGLKTNLLEVRIKRWKQNFGVPSVPFLISYVTAIDAICQEFKTGAQEKHFEFTTTFEITMQDPHCEVIVEDKAIATVEVPTLETPKVFIKTHNPTGGYTLLPDTYSREFIDFAVLSTADSGKVLEIGAAFGTATLRVLSASGAIDCNDIEPKNLAVISQRYAAMTRTTMNPLLGGNDKLRLLPGAFPEELAGLSSQSYKAILACRVLHFFRGYKIDLAMQRMAELLEPDGKLYVVCETPFQKNWQDFLPEHKIRTDKGEEWPGEIEDSSQFEKSERRGKQLPKFMHQLTTRELLRSAERTQLLVVEKCEYISRHNEFSDDALLEGQESVGLIARRIR